MSKSLKFAIPLILGAGFVAYLIYSSLALGSVTCEVCVRFNGRIDCRFASGLTADEATGTGRNNACALLADGRDQLIACTTAPPETAMCVLD